MHIPGTLFYLLVLGCAPKNPDQPGPSTTTIPAPFSTTIPAPTYTVPEPDPAAPIQTDQRAYVMDSTYVIPIVATYTNRTGRTVYPARCGFEPPRFHLEKQVGGEWVRAYRQVCMLPLLKEPVEVPPGAVYTDTVRLYTSPRFEMFEVSPIPGTYRIVYQIYKTWQVREEDSRVSGELLPPHATTSNAFLIRD